MYNNKYNSVDASTRFQMIMEYIVRQNGEQMFEAGDDEKQDGAQGSAQGGPQDGGAMPPMDGGDMPPMGGGQGAPQDGGAMPPMDGGQGAPQDGMMPPMDGGQGAPQDGGSATPEGFNPEGGMDDGMTPPMDGEQGDGGLQPDDEVIDLTDLTDAQEDTEKNVERMDGKFDEVLKAIGQFEELIRSNDEKIENLKTEFEKRNPTQIEKLNLRKTNSYPFNVTPEEYWKDKEATSNYSTEPDENGKEQGQYVITKDDVNGDTNWKAIADSLNTDDFMFNQTLNNLLKM